MHNQSKLLRMVLVSALLQLVAIEHGSTSSIQQQKQQQFKSAEQDAGQQTPQPDSGHQQQVSSSKQFQAQAVVASGQAPQAQATVPQAQGAIKQIEENRQLQDQTGRHNSQYAGTKQHSYNYETPAAKRLSDVIDEDQLPLATVNNHSNRNGHLGSSNNNNNEQVPQLRPPQYVDVSALVGRNASISSSSTGPYSHSSPSSLLSAKSRSGLPECATQQVCNAIFVRMNYTQRLCECSSNYNWKCSNNLDPQDGHTIELTRKFDKRIYTQIKTCEPLRDVRACKSPTDWTLLALQSERSGKAHYVVVCKCPTWAQLEGPYTHNHPPYANIPGIRVYGMLCAHQTARSSSAQTYSAYNPALNIYPEFPWSEALNVLNTTNLASTLDSH